MQMDDARARPILQRVLARRDAGSVCLRRKAVFLIAQESAAGTEDILLETARTDPDPEVREQAVFWLSQVGTDRAVGALDSILRTSTDRALHHNFGRFVQRESSFHLRRSGLYCCGARRVHLAPKRDVRRHRSALADHDCQKSWLLDGS